MVSCGDSYRAGCHPAGFASLKNQIIDSERSSYGWNCPIFFHTFEEQNAVDRMAVTRRFWDMFIVDALIGNWDQHSNGNWGFMMRGRIR